MPKYKKLYAEFHARGWKFSGLASTGPKTGAAESAKGVWWQANEIPCRSTTKASSGKASSLSLGGSTLPCAFLIDKNGNFAEFTDSEGIEAKVRNLLAG